jgi:hypothetical protein
MKKTRSKSDSKSDSVKTSFKNKGVRRDSIPPIPLDLETAVRAFLETGTPPDVAEHKAKKRKRRKPQKE